MSLRFQRAVIAKTTADGCLLPRHSLLFHDPLFVFVLLYCLPPLSPLIRALTSGQKVLARLVLIVFAERCRVRNTLCDCVSSASQLPGQGSLLFAERKQEFE